MPSDPTQQGFPSQASSPEIYVNPNTPQPKGMVAPGNTDLSKLPVIKNPDNSYSTVYSTGITDENPRSQYYGMNVLLRGILNGKKTDDVDALRKEYYKTGKHLGVFADPDTSDAYGQQLHNDWEAGKIPGVAITGPPRTQPAPALNMLNPSIIQMLSSLVGRK